MTENKRFMIDDTGTLIDMNTRNTYDYVSDVVNVLNDLNNSREYHKKERNKLKNREEKYQRVISGVMAFIELQVNNELGWDWND